jgi:FYVE, RhoGEF and PH domain containing 5/6
MAIDLESLKRELPRIEDKDDNEDQNGVVHRGRPVVSPRMSTENTSRPQSYYQILEDFRGDEPQEAHLNHGDSDFGMDITGSLTSMELVYSSDEIDSSSSAGFSKRRSREGVASPPSSFNRISPSRRKEDTARRRKRFSMPALVLQTTPVTARPNVIGEGKSQRTSLILGYKGLGSSSSSNLGHLEGSEQTAGIPGEKEGYGQGGAIEKLSELLEKTRGR